MKYLHRGAAFDLLHQRRDIFSSQAAAEAFAGYAADQLKRMEAFDLERMAEYEALTGAITARGAVGEVLEADTAKLKHLAGQWDLDLELLARFRKLHREHFSGYMGENRKAMVRKYQYDVKNAAHLIRLLRMGAEFIETGTLQVFRTSDADELKVIKRGGWSLEQVKEEAARLFSNVERVRARSPLKAEPDAVAANELLIAMHSAILGVRVDSRQVEF